jgi:hypothetical protein
VALKELMLENPIFKQLSEVQIDRLISESLELIVEKDHLLTRQNGSPRYIYFITRGIGQEKIGDYSRMLSRGEIVSLHSLVASTYVSGTKILN